MASNDHARISRRKFLEGVGTMAAGVAAAQLVGSSTARAARAQAAPSAAAATSAKLGKRSGLNILFVFTDQERYMPKLPRGVSLPGHERLEKTGVTFRNHYGSATMCTSSRSVLLTGLQTPNNRMFENVDFPWMKNLSPSVPTIGHMLRKEGYYTAYKGKFHLNKKFDTAEPDSLFTKEMEQYGFADYFTPGDIIGHRLGGYHFDHLIAGSAMTWLRRHGRPLSDEGKPWCLFVSLVNPHDIMYFNTDAPGQSVQDTGRLMLHPARAPEHKFYEATWDIPLPTSLTESFDTAGRPRAHGEFDKMWSHLLGHIPAEEERWRRFNDYYINCIRSVDLQLTRILEELDELGLSENTIVIFTSDHGEMAGAHNLRGKGPFAYEETLHLPFYVVHPEVNGGQTCAALSSHIDCVPTLLDMAGVAPGKRAELAGRNLPGKSLLSLLEHPGTADVHAARDSVLFTYSGLATNDSGLWQHITDARADGKNPAVALAKAGYLPDLKKRGSVRTVFDGRYKFSRYFSPREHNHPKTIDDLYKWNDVELFDLTEDPGEMNNLAANRDANRELIATMNGKLGAVIETEIGVDDGRELPNIPLINWAIERVDA